MKNGFKIKIQKLQSIEVIQQPLFIISKNIANLKPIDILRPGLNV